MKPDNLDKVNEGLRPFPKMCKDAALKGGPDKYLKSIFDAGKNTQKALDIDVLKDAYTMGKNSQKNTDVTIAVTSIALTGIVGLTIEAIRNRDKIKSFFKTVFSNEQPKAVACAKTEKK